MRQKISNIKELILAIITVIISLSLLTYTSAPQSETFDIYSINPLTSLFGILFGIKFVTGVPTSIAVVIATIIICYITYIIKIIIIKISKAIKKLF